MARSQATPSQQTKSSAKQTTLAGFFTKPKPKPSVPPAPTSAGPSTLSPASTNLRTPSSDVSSSPLTSRPSNGANLAANVKRAASPLKKALLSVEDDDEDLSPPPSEPLARPAQSATRAGISQSKQEDEDDDAMEVDDSPLPARRRVTKRKVIYAESDSDASSGEDVRASSSKAPTNSKARRGRKSLKADSDSDDFILDAADEEAMIAAADAYENSVISVSPSADEDSSDELPQGKSKKPAPKQKMPPSRPSLNPLGRPGSRPGSSSKLNGEASSRMASGSEKFLTRAEMRKIQEKEDKEANETCFDFLREDTIKDADGRRPDDPDYDKRTVYIPKASWEALKPFEKQFWGIKRNHFDTILFFQKGKFFELYENDAQIGHTQFDLKLTDRVKMKMVGVPEQSFDRYAAKFLGAGYKVGKVEQAETAIGAEMRLREENPGKGKPKDKKEDKIVQRSLNQVFTNGTIVDGVYLSTDEANHCASIREWSSNENGHRVYGICILDASTGEFNLSAFEDDVCNTRLETMFRQIRPKELLHAKGNLSVSTTRLLRNILPSNTLWQSFKEGTEFCSASRTIDELAKLFKTESDIESIKPELPEGIRDMLDRPVAMEALGGMLFYLRSLNLDKDLVTQKNFNIYDPIRQGKSLILDGQTLGHMEVLVNNEGGTEGTLLELLERCQTPFGKRLFRIWLTSPLRDVQAINDRLDAVTDIMNHPGFSGLFTSRLKHCPDLERLLSRIHAGKAKQKEFMAVLNGFQNVIDLIDTLLAEARSFTSAAVPGLLRTAPDMARTLDRVRDMFEDQGEAGKTIDIIPLPGRDAICDDAAKAVADLENRLEELRVEAGRALGLKDKEISYWHSAQGGKEIYQIQIAKNVKVPVNWSKQSGTGKVSRYYTGQTRPVIKELQEAREKQNIAQKSFFMRLLQEFDKDRSDWLKTIKVIAELDCLVSLAKASDGLDEPKCRPTFVDSEQAYVDFVELRHPSICLRSDFIANDVQLGGEQPRTMVLTGPNMAGKSTLLRMTAAAVIMAQLGCYVPAAKATVSPIDRIQTRMGAYDNMFASASTFKVELDECSKILREAGPRSLVILDELGRGTSTYDGMAIASAVLHHISTHTLPLAFFATHYGMLTDDFLYHPNCRNMHMATHVDEGQYQVVFLYKLIPGVAESSHGTHVAHMAGVPVPIVSRAKDVSQEFFEAFKIKLASRRRCAISTEGLADVSWLLKVAMGKEEQGLASRLQQLEIVAQASRHYDTSA